MIHPCQWQVAFQEIEAAPAFAQLPVTPLVLSDVCQIAPISPPPFVPFQVSSAVGHVTGKLTVALVPEAAIGLDRFNPYHAFARVPLASFVWRLRAERYRTICIHPFDRRFYGRDRILPKLGFDVFLGEEAFAGAARAGVYIADVEVARLGAELLREEGPGTFLFAITMANHGP